MGLFDFSGVLKARQSAQERVDALRNKIDLAAARRRAIQSAPAAKSELKAAIRAHVAKMSAPVSLNLQTTFAHLLRSPDQVEHPDLAALIGPASAGRAKGAQLTAQDFDAVLALLLAPQLGDALCKAVDALEMEDGPTKVVRETEIQKLGREIEGLQTELQQLIQEAEAAGVSLD